MIPLSKPYIGPEEKAAVLQVLDSGMLAQGPVVAQLEAQWAHACGTRHAIATANGTTALHSALLAHELGPDAEVITTPFTFAATASSILFAGARPVFVDIDPETFNLDPAQVTAAITPRTRAIMAVHLYGYMCDMDALMDIARRHDLVVIEDAAQAIGAEYQGKRAGSFGTGCFSLYATKNVMSAEGGMITTNDDVIAERCRLLRSHGMQRRYYHDLLGYNFRMSDLHAALGVAQLARLDAFTTQRRANAAYFDAHIESVVTPKVRAGYAHAWHQYTIRVNGERSRDDAIQRLNAAGVGTGVFYPLLVNQQPFMRARGYGDEQLPAAERATHEVLSIPVHPLLTPAELETIVQAVNAL